jgi:hypothetical protein
MEELEGQEAIKKEFFERIECNNGAGVVVTTVKKEGCFCK